MEKLNLCNANRCSSATEHNHKISKLVNNEVFPNATTHCRFIIILSGRLDWRPTIESRIIPINAWYDSYCQESLIYNVGRRKIRLLRPLWSMWPNGQRVIQL